MVENQDEKWKEQLEVYRVDTGHNLRPPSEHTYVSSAILEFLDSRNLVSQRFDLNQFTVLEVDSVMTVFT